MKTVILLFGEMGAGKSYWGKQIAAERANIKFIEGDLYVPVEMSERIARMLPPTKDQIEELIRDLLGAVDEYLEIYDGVVVSQALYRNLHREFMIDYWLGKGYEVHPIWVKVGFWQNLRQLWKRERGGLKWVLYWLMNKPFFEKPTHPHM